MTHISRFAQTIDAVVTELRTAGLTVFDGPETVMYLEDCVWVGYDANPSNKSFLQGTTSQDWSGTEGRRARSESFDIICAVQSVRGDNDVKATRDAAYDILGTVESVLRANPSLGFTPPFVAAVRPRETSMVPFEDGFGCRITFTISVKTRV